MKFRLAVGVVLGFALAGAGTAGAEEPTVEGLAADAVVVDGRPAWRIGESRDLWSRCRMDGFQYASWTSRYELSKDEGRSWQPLTREASAGCRFDWLVRAIPGAPAVEGKGPGATSGKPLDARASIGHLGENDFVDVGGKLLIAPWLGVDAALYSGQDLLGGAVTVAGRNLGVAGLDLTLTGGQGQRSQSGQFDSFGRSRFTTHQEAWGGLLQYAPPAGSPLAPYMPAAAARATHSATRDQTRRLSQTLETPEGMDTIVQAFRIAGGALDKEEMAVLGPLGLSLSLNHERLAYSGLAAVDSGLEALLGYHGKPAGLTVDLDAGYAEKSREGIYDGTIGVPFLGGQLGVRAEKTTVTTQQQLFYSYGHCGVSLHHTEFKLGSKDDGVMVSCGLLGAPDLRGPGFGTQLATDLHRALEKQGQIIADPVRGADIYSLLHASDRVRIQALGPAEVVSRNQRPVARITGTPSFAHPGDRLVADGSSSSDAEGPIAGYAWTVSGPCTGGGAVSGVSLPVTVNTDAAEGSICTLGLTVRDGQGLTGSTTVPVRITRTSGGPVAQAGGLPPNIQAGGDYYVDGSLSIDTQGGPVTYQWTTSGPCSIVRGATAPIALIHVPADAAGGVCTVGLTVRNGAGQSSTTSVSSTVRPAGNNRPPEARIAGLPAKLRPGVAHRVDGSGSIDPDGSVTGYAWQASGECRLSGPTNQPTAQVVVSEAARSGGSCWVLLTVTDNLGAQGSSSAEGTLDQRPTAVIKVTGTPVTPSGTFQVDGNGSSDPDGKIVAYQWSVNGSCSLAGAGNAASASIQVAGLSVASSCDVGLAVTDDGGLVGTATARVAVPPLHNAPPVARIRPSAVAYALGGDSLDLDGSASSDPDGTIVGYSWGVSGPCSINGGGSSAVVSVPRTFPANSVCNAQLTVTDNSGASASASVGIPLNIPPRVGLAVTSTGIAFIGSDQTLAATASDADGTIAGYNWSAGGACSLVSAKGNSATVHISGSASVGGTCSVSVTVTDNLGATATAAQNIIVGG